MLVPRRFFAFAWLCLGLALVPVAGAASGYDPLTPRIAGAPTILDLLVPTPDKDRVLPVLIYLPSTPSPQPAPIVLFSHGLGGDRHGSAYLGQHWAARGYVGVFVQHPGSDASVWKDLPKEERLAALRDAADRENFMQRVTDVPAVLDRLTLWQADPSHPLYQRLDMAHVGMSGHSFGAVTTQAVSGQSYGQRGQRFTDARIKAALALSPSPPKRGNLDDAFGKVGIPWMVMTGTLDGSPISDKSPEQRQSVFPALPAGQAYQLVLDKAEHSAFTERALPADKVPRNPNHHRAILALSTAFWDAYLRRDPGALRWLKGPEARSVLEPADLWMVK